MENGKIHVIVGENGAGKSSICKVITGLYKQTEGSVYISNKPVKKKERLKRTFFVGQDVDYQLYGYSVRNEFRIGNKRLPDEKIKDCLDEINLKISRISSFRRHVAVAANAVSAVHRCLKEEEIFCRRKKSSSPVSKSRIIGVWHVRQK